MKVVINGYAVEGSPSEIRELLGASAESNGSQSGAGTSDGNPSVWNGENARRFIESLDPDHSGGNQLKLVRYLVEHAKATWEEAYKLIGASGPRAGMEFAGTRACITRNARKTTGNDDANAVVWHKQGNYYYIPSGLRQLLKKAISEINEQAA